MYSPIKKLKLITLKPVKEKENKYNLVKPTKFRKGRKENRKTGKWKYKNKYEGDKFKYICNPSEHKGSTQLKSWKH